MGDRFYLVSTEATGTKHRHGPFASFDDATKAMATIRQVGDCDSWCIRRVKPTAEGVSTKPTGTERPVLVTTVHRGVFFGYASNVTGETVKLFRARLCVYWSPDVKGFMGLAANGPSESCRIGPPATIELRNVTSVTEVTQEAVVRWEAAPWKK